jgi:hypothetical protein
VTLRVFLLVVFGVTVFRRDAAIVRASAGVDLTYTEDFRNGDSRLLGQGSEQRHAGSSAG